MVVLNVMHVSIHKPECVLVSMNASVVGERLLRCGVMCFLYLRLLPMTYFLLQTYLCDVYDLNMLQQIMLPVLSHQGMIHECHLNMTKRSLLSEFLEL